MRCVWAGAAVEFRSPSEGLRSLAQPFAGDDAKIPMDRLLNQLEEDICDSADLIDGITEVFDVEAPKFKAKP